MADGSGGVTARDDVRRVKRAVRLFRGFINNMPTPSPGSTDQMREIIPVMTSARLGLREPTMFYRIKCAKVGNHQPICGFTPDHDIAKLCADANWSNKFPNSHRLSECGHYKYVWIQEVMDIVKCVPGSVLVAIMNVVMWESAAVKHPDGIPITRNPAIDRVLAIALLELGQEAASQMLAVGALTATMDVEDEQSKRHEDALASLASALQGQLHLQDQMRSHITVMDLQRNACVSDIASDAAELVRSESDSDAATKRFDFLLGACDAHIDMLRSDTNFQDGLQMYLNGSTRRMTAFSGEHLRSDTAIVNLRQSLQLPGRIAPQAAFAPPTAARGSGPGTFAAGAAIPMPPGLQLTHTRPWAVPGLAAVFGVPPTQPQTAGTVPAGVNPTFALNTQPGALRLTGGIYPAQVATWIASHSTGVAQTAAAAAVNGRPLFPLPAVQLGLPVQQPGASAVVAGAPATTPTPLTANMRGGRSSDASSNGPHAMAFSPTDPTPQLQGLPAAATILPLGTPMPSSFNPPPLFTQLAPPLMQVGQLFAGGRASGTADPNTGSSIILGGIGGGSSVQLAQNTHLAAAAAGPTVPVIASGRVTRSSAAASNAVLLGGVPHASAPVSNIPPPSTGLPGGVGSLIPLPLFMHTAQTAAAGAGSGVTHPAGGSGSQGDPGASGSGSGSTGAGSSALRR